MVTREIIHRRLLNQHIERSASTRPADVVAALGAMQAQDHLGALWAIGLRLGSATQSDVEQAVADRTIVRSWPLRGTLHFVPAADLRWMLALLTPRTIAGSVRRNRQLGLDNAVFARSREVLGGALRGGGQLSRDDVFRLLERAHVSTVGQRGYHILWRLGQEGLICFGPRVGKGLTFVLLDEWVTSVPSMGHDEALEALTVRYFTGHGPATLQDYVWWSGLKVADARAGIEMASTRLSQVDMHGTSYWMAHTMPAGAEAEEGPLLGDARGSRAAVKASDGISVGVHLLPAFDEYLVGYRDRVALLDPRRAPRVSPGGGGMLLPSLVAGGRVVGTWKRALKKDAVVVTALPFTSLTRPEARGFADAAERYGRFLGLAVEGRLEKPKD